MEIVITTEVKNGLSLSEQTTIFQTWFDENIASNITFGNGVDSVQTCTAFDEFNRPKEWEIEGIKIIADYYTQDVNYTFNKFIIYGTI